MVSRDADYGDDLAPGEVHQMGVFTATAAGTDDVAHELTIPEAATITAGEASIRWPVSAQPITPTAT